MRTILHVDMDAFFASVEQLFRPELRGKPVVVGGHPDGRSVVSAASYEARAFGVHSAMPMAWARKMCPHAVFLQCDGEKYARVSRSVFAVLESFTPDVEEASVDEAYMDVTGCERLFGPPLAIAHRVREAVWERLGLSASVGVASSRSAAKIASDLAKPAGLLMVVPGREADFLAPLPVGRMPGVGEVTGKRMIAMGIRTLGDLAKLGDSLLERAFGACGPELKRRAAGLGSEGLHAPGPAKSIGKETTFPRDVVDRAEGELALSFMVEKVCRRLRRSGHGARTVTVKLRYADFRTVSGSRTLPFPAEFDSVVGAAAVDLFRRLDTRRQGIRLLGVSVSRLQPAVRQLSLFDGEAELRRQRFYGGMDAVRDRFGFDAASRAAGLGK